MGGEPKGSDLAVLTGTGKLEGRHAVIFCPEDITTSLTGCRSFAVYGFTPESGLAVMRNVVFMIKNIPNVDE